MSTTYDFGAGPVPAHRHQNPDGSEGGWVADSAKVGKGVYIHPTAMVGPDCVLGDGVTLSKGAWLGGGVRLGDGVTIGRWVTLGKGVCLGPGSYFP